MRKVKTRTKPPLLVRQLTFTAHITYVHEAHDKGYLLQSVWGRNSKKCLCRIQTEAFEPPLILGPKHDSRIYMKTFPFSSVKKSVVRSKK